jgi:hypothetical protein
MDRFQSGLPNNAPAEDEPGAVVRMQIFQGRRGCLHLTMTRSQGGSMRRLLIPLVLALLTAAAGCGGGDDEDLGEPAAAAPATTVAATTTAPPATLAPETTAAPARAKALQQRLKRTYTKVTSVKETADAVTIETSYIFNDDNALAAVEICEAAKAALADSSFVEIMAVDDRWLARTTVFTGRCKATTLIR